MTTDTWVSIPDFSRYQINADGVVRLKPRQTEAYYRDRGGEVVPLNASDGPHPYYFIASDSMDRSCTITQAKLLELAFNRTD